MMTREEWLKWIEKVDKVSKRSYTTQTLTKQDPAMYYPPEMTAEEIREFELEMNELIDAENKDYYDNWYEEQYDLGDQ